MPNSRQPTDREIAEAISVLREMILRPGREPDDEDWAAALAWGESADVTDDDLALASSCRRSRSDAAWHKMAANANAMLAAWGLPPRFAAEVSCPTI